MSWHEGLHKKQIEAVKHIGSHARLLAGPGTGKTVTLTKRLLKLISEDGIPNQNILAVAFTRINAFDLRRTLKNELEDRGLGVPWVSTLHSYALRQLLRNSILLTTLPQPLRIADDFEERWIIRPDISTIMGISDREVRKKFADLSSDWQSLAVESSEYQPSDPRFMGAWDQHRRLYGYTLRSELIWQLKHAVEENPDTFEIEGKIEHLIVDEYQDLNKCDQAIIKKLADLGAEVYCAGDDDQSIYSFRRAHPAGIRRFPDEYIPSKSLDLEICWRCDKRIIEVSQHVANQDPNRLPKPMRPKDDAGEGVVHLLRFPDQYQEAVGVGLVCKHLIENFNCKLDDILILLRSDHQGRYSKVLTEELISRNIPCNVKVDRGTILDEIPGRLLLSLIRLCINSNDDLAWRTIFHLCGRRNQVGDRTIDNIHQYAIAEGLRFHQACYQVLTNPDLIARGSFVKDDMESLLSSIDPLSQLASLDQSAISTDDEVIESQQNLISELGDFSRKIIPDTDIRDEVISYITNKVIRSNSYTLSQLLNALTSPEDTLDQELEEAKINILTMHRAKGLSAKAVIIVAAEEQLIPGDAVGDEYDDSRRLLYVSLSRAKNFLYITYCNRRRGQQRHSGSEPGNPRRTLTPFLRGVLPIDSGIDYIQRQGLIRYQL